MHSFGWMMKKPRKKSNDQVLPRGGFIFSRNMCSSWLLAVDITCKLKQQTIEQNFKHTIQLPCTIQQKVFYVKLQFSWLFVLPQKLLLQNAVNISKNTIHDL